MDSTQRCRDQAAKCLRLMKSAPSKDQAEILRNISSSWSRLSGQIDRYNALVREQDLIQKLEIDKEILADQENEEAAN